MQYARRCAHRNAEVASALEEHRLSTAHRTTSQWLKYSTFCNERRATLCIYTQAALKQQIIRNAQWCLQWWSQLLSQRSQKVAISLQMIFELILTHSQDKHSTKHPNVSAWNSDDLRHERESHRRAQPTVPDRRANDGSSSTSESVLNEVSERTSRIAGPRAVVPVEPVPDHLFPKKSRREAPRRPAELFDD